MSNRVIEGVLLNEYMEVTLSEICTACNCHAEWILELVSEGVLDPIDKNAVHWRFPGHSVHKARAAMRLKQDLGINLPGVALALDLIDELEELRERLDRFDVNH